MTVANIKDKGLINLNIELTDELIREVYSRAKKDTSSFDDVVNEALRFYLKNIAGGFIKPKSGNKQ